MQKEIRLPETLSQKDREAAYYPERGDRDLVPQHELIGTCPAMIEVFHLIRKVAPADLPVMVTGASGTGKEMVARALHERSLRAQGPFVPVNCGAIPRELLESELFGHERGAFTGAFRTTIGKVERANHGTLFLDEVGELPLDLQVKLLRFLQDFSFERVGGRESKWVNLRVISATNRDLKELISEGRFREDLFYRLNGVNIALPDLRDRGDDLLIMALVFLQHYATLQNPNVTGFTTEALVALQNYPWPGNIRELINHIRRAVVMAEGPLVTHENLGLASLVNGASRAFSLKSDGLGLKDAIDQFKARLVKEALANARGNVQVAAQRLKTSRSVVYNLMKKHGLMDSY